MEASIASGKKKKKKREWKVLAELSFQKSIHQYR